MHLDSSIITLMATPPESRRSLGDSLNAIRVMPAMQKVIALLPRKLKDAGKGALRGLHSQPPSSPWQLPAKPGPNPNPEMIALQQCSLRLPGSAARNLIGRANRYLIWNDLLRYKDQGLKWFDFGGWYEGTTDPALLRINEFKKGFGGQVMREYVCEQIVTLRGWVALNAARLLKRARFLRSGSKPPVAQLPPAETRQPAAAL